MSWDPAGQLRSYMEGACAATIPMPTLDDAFARKDDVASDVQATVGAEMALRFHRRQDPDYFY